MAGITLDKGRTIYEAGQPLTALHLITNGKVSVTYPGGYFYLTKGDVIGICEICSEVHFLNYKVEEDTSIVTYPCRNEAAFGNLLNRHHDVARLFILSAFHQINTLLEHCSVSTLNCSSIYQNLLDDYDRYVEVCSKNDIIPGIPMGFDEKSAYISDETPDFWLAGYYLGLSNLFAGPDYQNLVEDSAVTMGFIRKCSLDFRKAYYSLEEQFSYIHSINNFYFNENESDLFALFSSLYYKIGADNEDSDDIYTSITQFIVLYGHESDCNVSQDLLDKRISSFEDNAAVMHESLAQKPHAEENITYDNVSDLIGSFDIILDFSQAAPDFVDKFKTNVNMYKKLGDKFSIEKEACILRTELTEDFNTLYSLVFKRCLKESTYPPAVKMFLYFGYLDEELAGLSNASYLKYLSASIQNTQDQGIYTLYHWLMAIYQGFKEPSRNEFDQDYYEYIHKQKLSGTITDFEAKELENNRIAKVDYELNNMFPSVNKITYGRISVFCPIFISENIFKDLERSYVTAMNVIETFNTIRRIDYTAFYRESLALDHLDTFGREPVHYEFLPDVILMPNVGSRGVMWQEIEGKKRNTPGRMFCSIFHLEDFNLTMIRLTGEFRWEMCKRIQGSRWNDIGERSLTSEYFDYVQFYKRNRELTIEAKEKVQLSLQRAKNSFKEMFVKDYIIWVMFESNASPRLNKVSRKIMFSYCPFPKDICDNLEKNPLYTELLSRHRVEKGQKLHRLNLLVQKLNSNNKPIPEILKAELKYIDGTI